MARRASSRGRVILHALAVGAAWARQSGASKPSVVSCEPANAQDSIVEQCNSWCKADADHMTHCTVSSPDLRRLPPPNTTDACPCVRACVRRSSANARAAGSAEVRRRCRPNHRRRRRFAAPKRRPTQRLQCASRGASANLRPSIACTANAARADSAVRAARPSRRRHLRRPRPHRPRGRRRRRGDRRLRPDM